MSHCPPFFSLFSYLWDLFFCFCIVPTGSDMAIISFCSALCLLTEKNKIFYFISLQNLLAFMYLKKITRVKGVKNLFAFPFHSINPSKKRVWNFSFCYHPSMITNWFAFTSNYLSVLYFFSSIMIIIVAMQRTEKWNECVN
jgi:hypothetical protein